jgi:glucose/arabinose dehydrogenase
MVAVSVMGLVRISASQDDLNNIITSVRVFPNLSFTFPISLVQLPGDDGRWFIAEQGGKIFSFLNDDQVAEKQLVLDITTQLGGIFFEDSQQWGITAIALHTNSSEMSELTGEVALFVAYNAKSSEDGSVTSFVSRFLSQDDGQTFETNSEEILFSVPQLSVTHHVGQLVFGPDGYLYIGFGDGSMSSTAQDLNDVRGSILRIDVNGPGLYTIPTDNPLVGTGQREEIFTWGWRNPWRFSLDAMTGDLWVGDVGNTDREEVTRAVPGRSHGWPYWEGTLCHEPSCEGFANVLPEFEYDHDTGTAVIGGYVYRGTLIPALQGIYVFSDWSRGKQLWAVLYDAKGKGELGLLGTIAAESGRPSGYAQDHQGELYHLSAQDEDAGIYKIVPKEP